MQAEAKSQKDKENMKKGANPSVEPSQLFERQLRCGEGGHGECAQERELFLDLKFACATNCSIDIIGSYSNE